MPTPSEDEDRPDSATSSGNAGARGSRGQANSGAQPDDRTDVPGNGRAPEGERDLRGGDAQGGGGAASDSSRSR